MRDVPVTRRGWIGAGLAAAAFGRAAAFAGASARADGPEALTFRLEETAGLRRFGYPVHTLVPGNPVGPNFRLERDGKPVAAQFRKVETADGRPAVALDFNASPGPLETQVYAVRFGDVEPGPEPKAGMTVTHDGGEFRVANGSVLTFTLPDTLDGFLKSVRNARLEFIRTGQPSRGLSLQARARDVQVPLGTKGVVTRQGPIAVGLRYAGTVTVPGGQPLRSVVDLTFPNSKSWVEARWSVNDPEGLVAMMGVDVPLLVEGAPTLIDLGASDTVYGQIRGDEWMTLKAGRRPGEPAPSSSWEVFKVQPGSAVGAEARFAAAPPRGAAAEGWAHVIDRSRCTAVAVAGFGSPWYDEITTRADGRVELQRWFARTGEGAAPVEGPKSLTFWLHFVTTPVQVGAATSPQAMLAPLKVGWDRPNG
jgi:hypothetical protein